MADRSPGTCVGTCKRDPSVICRKMGSSCRAGPTAACAVVEGKMPPEKSLHVAVLKTRFAYTIFKASGGKSSSKIQREKDKLKWEEVRLQWERLKEKATLEVAQWGKKEDLNIQCERERDALEKMEKTIVIYEGAETMRDFEMLISSSTQSLEGCP